MNNSHTYENPTFKNSRSVCDMVKVIIVKPNNTPEQEQELIRNIEQVMGKIIKEEFGVAVKVKLTKIISNENRTKEG